MKVLVFDLEMNQPSGKIIEVGYVIGETNNGNVYTKQSLFVNPKEQLSEFIIQLTGITQDQVDNEGHELDTVYEIMSFEHKVYGCFINPVVWGHGDSRHLRDELKKIQAGIDYQKKFFIPSEGNDKPPKDLYNDDNWPFGRRIIDVKTLYQAYRAANNKQLSGGLAKGMTKFGLAFEGKKHRAHDDAHNTFRIYCKLLEYFREER